MLLLWRMSGTEELSQPFQWDLDLLSETGDINASDNAFAHEATIRTMRRGFARVLDHQTIIDILANGDRMHDEALREREKRRASAPVTTTH